MVDGVHGVPPFVEARWGPRRINRELAVRCVPGLGQSGDHVDLDAEAG
jgi:hypothetical protein